MFSTCINVYTEQLSHGSSEKVGQWMRAEEEGSGEGACPIPSYGGPEVSPPENFFKYRCKSVQFGAFLATSATENVQLSV